MKTKNIFFTVLAIIGCIFLAFSLNNFIERVVIPDPCFYHNHDFKTSKLFDLFYEFTASEGYHPAPTILNYVLTLAVGTSAGLLISVKRFVKQNYDRKCNTNT